MMRTWLRIRGWFEYHILYTLGHWCLRKYSDMYTRTNQLTVKALRGKQEDDPNLEEVILVGGQVIKAHLASKCFMDRACCIHRPSDHHMIDWPQNWRGDRGMMERICPHGIGHPDPDDLSEDKVHGCDRCCNVKEQEDAG